MSVSYTGEGQRKSDLNRCLIEYSHFALMESLSQLAAYAFLKAPNYIVWC